VPPAINWGLIAIFETSASKAPEAGRAGLILLPLLALYFAASYMAVLGSVTAFWLMFRTHMLYKLLWAGISIAILIASYALFIYWLPTE
jgi:hypothetical protein